MARHTKVQIILLVTLLLVGGSLAETSSQRIFKEMMQWLISPTEKLNEVLETKHGTPVAKDEHLPAESRVHSSNDDYKRNNLKLVEYDKSEESEIQNKKENSDGHENSHEGSQSKHNEKEYHHKNGNDLKGHKHKDKYSQAEDRDSTGHKGHSFKSEGHFNKGQKGEGHKNMFHNKESGREKKFFDNAEEIIYSSEHDHLLANHKAESKGNFESKAKEDSHLHDNKGKKSHKERIENFDKFHKEKDSHGHREDYGKHSDFERKGKHEGSFSSSKGKGSDFGSQGSHSIPRPVKIEIESNKDKLKSDFNTKDQFQTSDSSNIPLSTVLEHAGYAQKIEKLPNKKIKTQKEIDQKLKIIPTENEIEYKETQSEVKTKDKQSNLLKLRNKARKVPVRKNIKKRKISSELDAKSTISNDKKLESSNNNIDLLKEDSKKRKLPIINRRLRKITKSNATERPNKHTEKQDSSKMLPIKAKKRTRLIPHRRMRLNSSESNHIPSKSVKDKASISLFVKDNSKQKLKNNPSKIVQGLHAGHKKHHGRKNLNPKRKTEKEETNEIKDSKIDMEPLHPSVHKPVIISDPFLTPSVLKTSSKTEKKISDYKNKLSKDSNEKKQKPKNSVRIVNKLQKNVKESDEKLHQPQQTIKIPIKTLKKEKSKDSDKHEQNLKESKVKNIPQKSDKKISKESNKQKDQSKTSKISVEKPLQKDRSHQISVVSTDKLEPSSTHQEHHKKNTKPKKYAQFNSFDKGHHNEASKKVEKGGFEEKGSKGKSEKDYGKLHDEKFIDKEKKEEKGHKHEKHYEGHFDKGVKGSKGHAHGKKSRSHKGHSDKGFKNVHHKLEYASKDNFYHDDELKKKHKVFDDFDSYFEKKRQENMKALNLLVCIYNCYNVDDHHKKKYGYKDYHSDDGFHDYSGSHKNKYGRNGYHGNYQHHGHKSHKDRNHGHHLHKGYTPHHDHRGYYSYHDYDYNYY